jgi:pyruvate dehydrogenase E2 component (dihydrolipoamide acetyltransferase)
MPQLGETVTEGTITRWLKQPGDPIKADEPLFEVSTDKVDSEVPAPTSGVLAEIRIAEGETAAVGTVLAVISDAGAAAPPTAAAAGAATAPPPPAAPAPAPAAPPPAPAAPAPPPPSTPAVPPMPVAAPTPQAAEPVAAPRFESRPAEPPAPPPPPAAPTPSGADETEPGIVVSTGAAPREPVSSGTPPAAGAALTSPVVRRLMAEHGLDPADVTGTGEGGRITRKDVLDAAARSRDATMPEGSVSDRVAAPLVPPAPPAPAPAPPPAAPAPPAPAPAPPPPAAPAPPAPAPPAPAPVAPAPSPVAAAAASAPAPDVPAARSPRAGGDLVIPFSNMRKRTAEHMVRSKSTSPHVSTAVEVDFERVERVRSAHQAEWKAREGFTLTYLPFVARAFCDTVDEFPNVNASVVDESLVVHADVHLSIAVDLDFEGLIAPVVRDADGKRIRLIAREIHEMAARAKAKQLMPDEVLGGTFTITNPGPFGTYLTIPIINQPQVAILATDGITKRARVVQGPDGLDVIAVRHIGLVGLTWDHRAFDGAYAAAFLDAMRERLEHHDWASELD